MLYNKMQLLAWLITEQCKIFFVVSRTIIDNSNVFFDLDPKVHDVVILCTARPTTSPPRFLSRLTNQTVTVGQAVTFEAEVNGVPVPMLSWQKDNSHIVGGDHYQIHTEGCRSTLYIPYVRPDDDAWYQCTAASVSGTATNRVRLVVQAAPRPASTRYSLWGHHIS
jgi:Immunoglobulin I-set domain